MLKLEIAGRIPGSIFLTLNDFQSVFLDLIKTFDTLTDQDGVIELKFVGPVKMRTLNHLYAGNEYTTDVLSFTYDDSSALVVPDDTEKLIASIVICTQQAISQAAQYDQTVRDEVMLLFVHGFIHTLGHDHASEFDQTRFERLQNAIMKKNNYKSRNFSWSR